MAYISFALAVCVVTSTDQTLYERGTFARVDMCVVIDRDGRVRRTVVVFSVTVCTVGVMYKAANLLKYSRTVADKSVR